MSCCGQKRAQQRQTSSAFVHELTAPHASGSRFPMGMAYFEYIGPTAITVVGNATGRQYRFATPNVPVTVDARDRGSLARVSLLREVR
jgi:hypothetical protein